MDLSPVQINKETILKNKIKIDSGVLGAVYFLIKDQEIVYVGKSKNFRSRIATHISDKSKDFDSYYAIFEQDHLLDSLERYFITKFDPKYNKDFATIRLRRESSLIAVEPAVAPVKNVKVASFSLQAASKTKLPYVFDVLAFEAERRAQAALAS